MRGFSLLTIVYLIIGVILAVNRGYNHPFLNLSHFISFVLAVVLWPLVLLKVDLHVRAG